MPSDKADQFGHVTHVHVVAALLALAEQDDVLPGGSKTAEAVGAVPVVRIGGTVNQRWAQDRQLALDGVFQHQFAGQMHDAVQRAGLGAGHFIQGLHAVGVDGVGADVDDVLRLHLGKRVGDAAHHADVAPQHGGVLAGRFGRDDDEGVGRRKSGGKGIRRAI